MEIMLEDKDEVREYGDQWFEYLQRMGGIKHKHGNVSYYSQMLQD